MSKKESIDMSQADTAVRKNAVELKGVTKIFTQWQRENTGKGLLRNLIQTENLLQTTFRNFYALSRTE